MARNEEKHFCNLNKLILLKEKEEYEKAFPSRPRLNTLDTPEDIQKWLPSIKRDIDFYLKKSQVICYSDAHVEECREKVVKLEKEFKAFVRKIKQLSPSPLDVIPWTSRPYKRKKIDNSEEISFKEFKRIATPILEEEKNSSLCVQIKDDDDDDTVTSILYSKRKKIPATILNQDNVSEYDRINWSVMDRPLTFSSMSTNQKKPNRITEENINIDTSNSQTERGKSEIILENQISSLETTTPPIKKTLLTELEQYQNANQTGFKIVNYDSSDDENL